MAVKLPKATVIRLFKTQAHPRIERCRRRVNKIVVEIAKGAIKFAKAAGRKTVRQMICGWLL